MTTTTFTGGPFHGHTKPNGPDSTRSIIIATINSATSPHTNLPADAILGTYIHHATTHVEGITTHHFHWHPSAA